MLFKLICFVALTMGLNQQTLANSEEEFKKVTPYEIHQMLKKNQAFLVDTREQADIEKGMAIGAMWMPLSRIQKQGKAWKRFISDLNPNRKIIVYNSHKTNTLKAARYFQKSQFDTLIMDSFDDWKAAKYATRKGP